MTATPAPTGPTATVYGAVITLVSAVISLAFAFVAALGDGPALSEGQVTAHAVAIAGAIYTLVQANRRAPAEPTGKGIAASIVLPIMLVLGVLVFSTPGCIPRQVVAERSIAVDIQDGPPCVVTVTADGRVASTITGPRCDVQPLPGPTVPPTVAP